MRTAAASGWPGEQVGPFLGFLVAEGGLSPNTVQAYRRDLVRFARYCQGRGLVRAEQVTAADMQGYARSLSRERLATTTVARHLVTARMFFRFHVLTSQLRENVCALLEMPKAWQRLPGVLNRVRAAELVEGADPARRLYRRDRALLELLYATGMRAAEAAGLQRGDVNFQAGFSRVFGKGGRERIVPVHAGALRALQEYLEQLRPGLVGEGRCEAVFVSRTGRALSRIEVWRIVRRAARRAGLAGRVTPHTLRHCFGSHLLQGGADLRSVQEMLGHADVATTQIYTHVDQEHLRSVHRKYHPRP